jgi:hypothetical protein
MREHEDSIKVGVEEGENRMYIPEVFSEEAGVRVHL